MAQLMCRTCLATCGELVPIFSDDCYVNDLPDKLLNTIRLEVQKDDELPKMMCKKCVFLVDSWNCFKDQCEMAEIKLKSSLNNSLPSISNVGQLLSELDKADQSYVNFAENETNIDTSSDEDYPIEYASEEAKLEVESARKQRRYTKSPNKKNSGVKVKSVEILPTDKTKNIYRNLPTGPPIKYEFPPVKEEMDISDSDDKSSINLSDVSSKYSSNRGVKAYNDSFYSKKYDSSMQHKFDIKEITKRKMESDSSFSHLSKVPKKVMFKDDHYGDSDLHSIETKRIKTESPIKVEYNENHYNSMEINPIKIIQNYRLPNNISKNAANSLSQRELPTIASNGNQSQTCLKQLMSNFMLHFPEICVICSASFETSLEVLKHKLESHLRQDQECFFCPICHHKFRSNKELLNHVDNHDDVCSLICGLCSGPFYTKRSLKTHLASHVDLYDLRCKTCSKKFHHVQSLLVHLRQHITSDHLTCMLCSNKLPNIEQLQSHIDKSHSRHLMHKNAKCETCGMRLPRRELVEHVKVHDNHTCSYCNKSFLEKESLREHIEAQHLNPQPPIKLSCLVCDKSFGSQDERTQHMQKQHMTSQQQEEQPNQLSPTFPQLPPPSGNDRKKFRCRVCHEILVSRYAYGQHLKDKHLNVKQASDILRELSESSLNEQLQNKNNDTSSSS